MSRMTVLGAAFILAACSGGAGESADTAEGASETVIPAALTQSLAADGQPPEGWYQAVDDEALVVIEELRADGTFSFVDAQGNLMVEGSYHQKTPELLCFTADADGVERCFEDTIDEDGVWRSKEIDTGIGSVITRIDPPEAE
ncbi:MAG: hypothetical protein AAF127_14175 [Pseudomonadota bacterium]